MPFGEDARQTVTPFAERQVFALQLSRSLIAVPFLR
jgi:hypothetical protein